MKKINMKINASLNFQHTNVHNNQLTGHETRDYKHIKNTNVQLNKSNYNYYKNMGNHPIKVRGHFNGTDTDRLRLIRKLDRQHYGKFLKQRNHKYIKQHRKTKIVSLKQFMNSSKSRKNRTEKVVVSLGHNVRQRINTVIERAYSDKPRKYIHNKESAMYSAALRYYNEHFNQRHHSLRLIAYATNVDEVKHHLGAAHTHNIIYNQGHTKKGKPSSSFTNAIELDTGHSNNRKALRSFNEQESRALIRATEHVANLRFQRIHFNFEYQTKQAKITGLSMDNYKKLSEARNKRLIKFRKRVNKVQDKLDRTIQSKNKYRKSRYYYKSAANELFNQADNDIHNGMDIAHSYIDSGINKGFSYANSGLTFSYSTSQSVSSSVAYVSQSVSNAENSANSDYQSMGRDLIKSNKYVNRRMSKLKKKIVKIKHRQEMQNRKAKELMNEHKRNQSILIKAKQSQKKMARMKKNLKKYSSDIVSKISSASSSQVSSIASSANSSISSSIPVSSKSVSSNGDGLTKTQQMIKYAKTHDGGAGWQ